jgi:hypothetical protein
MKRGGTGSSQWSEQEDRGQRERVEGNGSGGDKVNGQVGMWQLRLKEKEVV